MDALTAFVWAMVALLIAVGLNVANFLAALYVLGRMEAREIERNVHKIVEAANADNS